MIMPIAKPLMGLTSSVDRSDVKGRIFYILSLIQRFVNSCHLNSHSNRNTQVWPDELLWASVAMSFTWSSIEQIDRQVNLLACGVTEVTVLGEELT